MGNLEKIIRDDTFALVRKWIVSKTLFSSTHCGQIRSHENDLTNFGGRKLEPETTLRFGAVLDHFAACDAVRGLEANFCGFANDQFAV